MKTLKVKDWDSVPNSFTGIIEFSGGSKWWLQNKKLHREDGPAIVYSDGYKEWHLGGKWVWSSSRSKIFLKNKIILSKEQHPKYPTVQVWKYIDGNGFREQVIVPGMEDFIIEKRVK